MLNIVLFFSSSGIEMSFIGKEKRLNIKQTFSTRAVKIWDHKNEN